MDYTNTNRCPICCYADDHESVPVGYFLCRRYPKPIKVSEHDWCGEMKVIGDS